MRTPDLLQDDVRRSLRKLVRPAAWALDVASLGVEFVSLVGRSFGGALARVLAGELLAQSVNQRCA